MSKAPTRSGRTLRCAVYTRKSSEEGLEQEFNSLHAQREACEAFIRSQRHEGWSCLPQAYDDGGRSGGNLERPALQQLLSEIREGKVDVVVVYKIDRLTRSLADFAKIGGVGLQTVRDWVLAFNAEGPPGLVNGKAPGNAPLLNDQQRQALHRIVESGPLPAVHGVVRWRLIDLAQWVFDEFRISISKQTLSRELRAVGFRKLSARPRHHAQDERR